MSATGFRHETTEPTAPVKLAPGVHKLRLTVVDDAGMVSQPDTVVIKVERIGLPVIDHVDPARGRRGSELDVTLIGEYLGNATAVRIFRGDEEDRRVRVESWAADGDERLNLRLEILAHAGLGARLIEVTTPRGAATAKFTVITDEKPRIINLTPTWMTPAGTQAMAARIEGDNLEHASVVRFKANGVDDAWVVADVRQANQEYVDVDVRVSADAAFGARTLAVEAPAGVAASPPGVQLAVMPGAIQIAIMVLAAAAAILQIALNFPDWRFTALGVGHLVLAALLYWPSQWISRVRSPLRWLLLAYTGVALVVWLAIGQKLAPIDFFTPVVELLLVILLVAENQQVRLGKDKGQGA